MSITKLSLIKCKVNVSVLPQQRRVEAMLRAVVQGAADHAGLRAVGALGAELPAAAAGAQHAPRLAAQLHPAARQ